MKPEQIKTLTEDDWINTFLKGLDACNSLTERMQWVICLANAHRTVASREILANLERILEIPNEDKEVSKSSS